ncbi:hypothetical protein [Paeniglutamicibacter sp. Y32M11]|uniref:hypothetical protein n=1 Tax=Paeniglutamicibacter sp. Y32M11 TaxID=2853258 RepID=UPI001C532774|nr:hypothetical protein [Paeniglutamicibacter sp. Y32M11]QXQ11722.1 hypothetical protein KUF55_07550 [Paeniglutamicibacter sp. Y32M11]
MTIEGFRLNNFDQFVLKVRGSLALNPLKYIEAVQVRILEELGEWRRLGSEIGYFPLDSIATSKPVEDRAILEIFRRQLSYSMDLLEPDDIKAIGLIFYADDSEWKKQIMILRRCLSLRSKFAGVKDGDRPEYGSSLGQLDELLDQISWISSYYISDIIDGREFTSGYPSDWRFATNELIDTRIDQLQKFVQALAKRARKSRESNAAESFVEGKLGSASVRVHENLISKSHQKSSLLIPARRRNLGRWSPKVTERSFRMRAFDSFPKRTGRKLIDHLNSLPGSTLKSVVRENNIFVASMKSESPESLVFRENILKDLAVDPKQVKFLNVSVEAKSSGKKVIGPLGEEIVHISSATVAGLWEKVSSEVRKSGSKVVVVGGDRVSVEVTKSAVRLVDSKNGAEIRVIGKGRGSDGLRAPLVFVNSTQVN